MRIVKQNRFKNLGELHEEWTEAGAKASRATTHRRVKEFGYRGILPGLRRRRTSQVTYVTMGNETLRDTASLRGRYGGTPSA